MSFAILVSLLVAFTLTPMLTAQWLGGKRKKKVDTHDARPTEVHSSRSGGFYGIIDRFYTVLLKWSMGHRWVIALVCAGVLASIPTLWNMLPYNFLPEEDESQFQVSMETPLGTSLAVTRSAARKIDAELRKMPVVEYTLLNSGGGAFGGGDTPNQASIYVRLTDVEKRRDDQATIVQRVRRQLRRRGANLGLTEMRVSPVNSFSIIGGGGGGGGGGSRIQYVLSGPDLEVLKEASERAVAEMEKVPGVSEANTSLELGQPELNVDIDRDFAGELGVRPATLANTLRYLVGGSQVTDYIEGGEQYEVHLRADPQFRGTEQGIGQLTVPASPASAGGQSTGGTARTATAAPRSVTLDQLVKFSRSTGPSSIQRYNRRRQITLSATVEPGASEATIGAAVERIAQGLNLGPAYSVTASGSSREQQRTNAAFMLAIGMSMIFMYLILAAQFESWLHPVTILLSLPLTLPFALISLLIFGQSLNIFSLLGVLVLFGVVKKNAILQIDLTNQLREKGANRYDAIIQANRDRLRPILMTTLAFVAGMIPLVFSSGTGAGTNRAIGSVIFGGQILSLLLTLLAVPVAYSLFDDAASVARRLRNKLLRREEEPDELARTEAV
jgi:HAE1 family hydrophobic/amphiphilic exporter-1